jgi:hypothetical protein
MRFLLIAAILLAGISGLGTAQDKPKPNGIFDAKKCTPRF